MTLRSYIPIECDMASAEAVRSGLSRLAVADAKVLSAETATGPFDVIVLLESADLDRLGHAVTEGIQRLSGVRRTATCVVIDLA